jgi:transcriptional regulator with XRE-family HTH domain
MFAGKLRGGIAGAPCERVGWDMATRFNKPSAAQVGVLLRSWRQQRRRTQLELALDAEISQRHLSFVESGRASPSREMLLRLADRLDVPLRDRNALLFAAGFAPVYAERPLEDAAMSSARRIIGVILRAHTPNPALAVDRHWRMVMANDSFGPLLDGVSDPTLLEAPVNVLRLSLHPGGLAPHIANLPQWRSHVLERLRRQAEASADPVLTALLCELAGIGGGNSAHEAGGIDVDHGIAVPLELNTREGRLSLISTTTVFGTATEIILSELVIESFYPADEASAGRLIRLQQGKAQGG